jgi:hypothetical protein
MMRARRAVVTTALACVAIAPAMLERHARARVLERLARCPDGDTGCGGVGSLALDASGLRLDDLWLERRGWVVGAHRVRLRPDWTGAHVDVVDPWIERTRIRTGPTTDSKDPPAHSPGRRLPDVRVTIAATGALVLPGTPLGTVIAIDPVLAWRPGGPLRLRAQGSIEHAWGRVETVGPMDARVSTDEPRRVAVRGALSIGGGMPTAMTAALEGTHLRVELDDGEGGHLAFEAKGRGESMAVSARTFALGRIGAFGPRAVSRLGLDLSAATLDGELEAERASAAGIRVHVHELTVSGLRMEHHRISRVPIELDALTVAGDLVWQPRDQQAQLTLAHNGAQLHLAATRTPEALTMSAELPRVSCQTLFDALPQGITDALDGMRWTGDVEGKVALSIDLDALAAARADPDSVGVSPPGELDLGFAPFDACSVVADAPEIDLLALRGPYRHRFVDNAGRAHERVMTPGAPDYAPLSSIPRVARAFTALEDTRFWRHDGFDRQQLEKALWYDLAVGRVARGASTITQQAARCLWLGVDRSLARKLQESILATRLEHALDKSRILELYLNVIELGPGVHGVAEASMFHFGKPVQELDAAEALHLASLAPAPRALTERFAEHGVDDAWMAELHRHLRRMHLYGQLGHDELLRALRTPIRLRARAHVDGAE